jgi:hypothetical protein
MKNRSSYGERFSITLTVQAKRDPLRESDHLP